jgi:hypothetical protein
MGLKAEQIRGQKNTGTRKDKTFNWIFMELNPCLLLILRTLTKLKNKGNLNHFPKGFVGITVF